MQDNNTLWVLGHRISPIEVSGNYDMIIGQTPPNVPGPPPHFHSGYHELFMVLEGEMDFIVNGEAKKIRPGETIDLPPNVIHTFKNGGSSICKFVNIHSPKGFLPFFKDMGIAETESEAMQKSVDQRLINKFIQQAASYDMHIRM